MDPKQFERQLAGHVLDPVQAGKVTAYYLRKPGAGRMMSTLILFMPEGIALMGDLTPERNGSVSALGYGLEWFAGDLSPDYLASKFLEKKWCRELAGQLLREREYMGTQLDEDGARQKRFDRIADRLDDGGPERLHEELEAAGWDTSDGVPGYGYDPSESGWLAAIQQTFARLYAAASVEAATT